MKITQKQRNIILRTGLSLCVPILIWSIYYFGSFRYVLFLSPDVPSIPAGYSQNVKVDFDPLSLKNFLSSVINIPFSKFNHLVCLENKNKITIKLGENILDANSLPVDIKGTVGAMNVHFVFKNGSFINLYANVGSTSCTTIDEDNFSTAQLTGEFSEIGFNNVIKNPGSSDQKYPNASSTIDSSNSKLKTQLDPSSAVWMLIFILIGWNVLLLLMVSVKKFIFEGN